MKRLILSEDNKEQIVKEVVQTLKRGGLIVFPSDTVYGFLTDATSDKAVKKLISFKNRPAGKPISVFVDSFFMLHSLVKVDAFQEKVLKEILPGPFTVILPSKGKVSPLIESEKKTLGVRLPAYDLIINVVKAFGKPITATSANISGKGPHWSVEAFLNTLSEKKKSQLDLIVDAGKLPFRKPSTVVDLTSPDIKILRKGDIMFLNTREFISSSAKQTRELGKFFAFKYLSCAKKSGLVFIVEGELGVGKTQLAKGVGSFLGVEKDIVSPSFVGFFEYKAKKVKNFYHFDLWGLRDVEEIEEFKIDKLANKSTVIFIEWGERIGEIIKNLKNSFLVYIKMRYKSKNERIIEISEVKR